MNLYLVDLRCYSHQKMNYCIPYRAGFYFGRNNGNETESKLKANGNIKTKKEIKLRRENNNK